LWVLPEGDYVLEAHLVNRADQGGKVLVAVFVRIFGSRQDLHEVLGVLDRRPHAELFGPSVGYVGVRQFVFLLKYLCPPDQERSGSRNPVRRGLIILK
jgi:hypothetical protein